MSPADEEKGFDFDRLKVVYKINFKIITKTPLSIKAGKSVKEYVDSPIVRIGNKPYIPGSTLKGIIRSEAERFARIKYGDDPRMVCNILDPRGKGGELEREKDEKENYIPCLICRIFGGPTIASHVLFEDAIPDNSIPTEVKRRVSINRVTGGQSAGRLFQVEYVVPGSEFKSSMTIFNIDFLNEYDKRSEILKHVLKLMKNDMVRLGSMRSAGYGAVEFKFNSVKKYIVEKGEEDVLNDFLKWLER